MEQVVRKVFDPLETVDKLSSLGVVSREIVSDLRQAVDLSRAGRIFGHPSANELPRTLYAVAEKCAVLCGTDPAQADRCRDIFDARLLVRRPRRVTVLNNILAEIGREIEGKSIPDVPSATPIGFFARMKKLFVRK